MCGFSVILNSHKDKSEQLKLINDMNLSIQNRGPDYSGCYDDENIILGHQRLSIIDLSSASNQPMINDEYVIVYNGEIYNFKEIRSELISIHNEKFETNGDTEVLLKSYKYWGKDCLKKLNGIFSFVIWNRKKKELFCARDRFGVKPIYYSFQNDGEFICSSEVKGIFAYGKKKLPNYNTLKQYLIQGVYGHNGQTFFEDIFQLQAGHCLFFNCNNQITVEKYYQFEDRIKNLNKYKNEKEAYEEYSYLINDSIQLQLVSDVNLGVTLSSGLDSSILFSHTLENTSENDLTAYTYTFNDSNYDESKYVQDWIAEKKWRKISFDGDNFFDDIKKLIINQCEPIGGLSLLGISEIFKMGRKLDDTIVYLCGEGIDEQWCGYDYYQDTKKMNLQNISMIQGTKNAINKNILHEDFMQHYKNIIFPTPFETSIDNLKFRDLFFTKIPRNLGFLDRISMLHSVEARVPFLDHRLVEASFRLPEKFMLKKNQGKYLLRNWYSQRLPNYATKKNKQFIQSPQREWLGNSEFIEDMLISKSFKERSIFNNKEVKKSFRSYKNGEFDNSFFIWQWLNLEIWFQTIIEN